MSKDYSVLRLPAGVLDDMFSVLDECREDIEGFIEKIKPEGFLHAASLSHIRHLLNVCYSIPKRSDHARAKAVLAAYVEARR